MISNNLETLCTKFVEHPQFLSFEFEDLCLQEKESSQSLQEVKSQVKEHLYDVLRIMGGSLHWTSCNCGDVRLGLMQKRLRTMTAAKRTK